MFSLSVLQTNKKLFYILGLPLRNKNEMSTSSKVVWPKLSPAEFKQLQEYASCMLLIQI